MHISEEEVTKVADLARLALSPPEVEAMTSQLGAILDYIAKLDELDCHGVPATTHALSLTNAFRADETQPSLSQAEALANAPQDNGESFIVPRVI